MTDVATSRAAARQREITQRRKDLTSAWPDAWRDMLARWRSDGPDAVWLMYAANYLLRAGGLRWAIDPVRLGNRVPEAAAVDAGALSALDVVLLTHNHADHVDPELLGQLARFERVRWVMLPHMLAVAQGCGVPTSRIIVARPGEAIALGATRITLFEGLHWEYPGRWRVGKPVAGVESTACLAEWSGRRALFPGDTRTYDAAALPALGPVDALFAHVWLGRGAALEPEPPLLEAMGRFVADLAPRQRVVLAHLWEVARIPEDYWDVAHAQRVKACVARHLPTVETLIPDFWTEAPL